MKKITIIIPLHEYNEKYLTRALSSFNFVDDRNIKYYQVIIVGPQGICEECEKIIKNCYSELETRILVNTDTDFATQINKAVFDCVTPYFTVLEFDDMYTDNYFKNMQEFIQRHSEYSVVLPVNELINTKEEMVSFCNEIALDPSFTDSIGDIGMDELQIFMDFNCTGGLFKTEDFISIGGLKKSLKIAMWYEFLLRTCYKGKKIYVLPKIGYLHTIDREGSYMKQIQNTISQEEGKFLIDTARQEYFFKEDRNIVYNSEKETV